MRYQGRNPKENLEQALAELRGDEPATEAVRAAGDRVWQRLGHEVAGAAPELESIRGCSDIRRLLVQYRAGQLAAERAMVVEAHLHECVACRREMESGQTTGSAAAWQHELPRARGGFRWAIAAAAIVALGVSIYFIQAVLLSGPSGMRARVESLSGGLYRIGFNGEQAIKVGDELAEGERVRTAGGSRAALRLRDGSVVEMNERAEFAVSLGRRDTTIKLDRGNIIVQAAKRSSGHLYVAAPDCRVSVTGTVFAVNSGMKGSRVSVIEGEVRVAEAGMTSVLHPGDQLSTNPSVSAVPVKQEIAWSQDLDKHLALLAAFQHLSNKLEAVQMPGLRYQSKLLPTLPADTILYAGIPNLGDAAQQANQLFQQELQESPVLNEWWQQVQSRKGAPDFAKIIDEIHSLGQYLGDEIVVSVGLENHKGAPLVVAQVQKPGLKEFIEQEAAQHSGNKGPGLHVLSEQELMQMSPQQRSGLLIVVRPDFVAASFDVLTLQRFDSALNQGGGGFASTPFGQRMAAAYQQGTDILLGANLQAMAGEHAAMHPRESGSAFQKTGLADVQYLVVERKNTGGQLPLNHVELTFTGPRRGMASWLAAPAPIGGLDFVSKDAGAVASFVSKNPAQMLDDVLGVAYSSNAKAQAEFSQAESELNINFHKDLAETLGGEITFALDGPILPTPSWKVVAEVYNPGRLQSTIQQLVNDANQQGGNKDVHVSLEQSSANGLTFYTVHFQHGTNATEVDYTFTGGYMIIAPSRALVMNAITVQQSGNSLAKSSDFRALLPQDQHANVSAVLYQNLAPLVGPVMKQLTPAQLQSLQQLAAESKPSVVCAYGEDNAIRIASNTRFFGLDLNTMALSTLMKLAHPPGTFEPRKP